MAVLWYTVKATNKRANNGGNMMLQAKAKMAIPECVDNLGFESPTLFVLCGVLDVFHALFVSVPLSALSPPSLGRGWAIKVTHQNLLMDTVLIAH